MHVGTTGNDSKDDEVRQPKQGVQGEVGVPQVPLLGHGGELETPNWACREYRTRNIKNLGQPISARWPGPGRWTTGPSSSL